MSKKINKVIRMLNLKKIKEFNIKEVNITELPDKCLQKKEKKD